jgi:hypothetical protein
MTSWRAMVWIVCATMWLGGCLDARFDVPARTIDEASYTTIYPWYAEFCAVSEFNKKPGFGPEIASGGPGGHSVLYLNGVCREKNAGYPVVMLCGPGNPKPGEGVGLSVNDHYQNANWVATEGRDFVMHGDLRPGEPVTKANYLRTQAKAMAMGILDGVVFHDEVFKDQPAGMSKIDFMYDMSIATDYGINLGRDRYCARIPLNRAKMARVVDYLNAVNAPYRSGKQVFRWNVLENNCSHLAHNVLAVAGVWPQWPANQPFLIAVFDFPVPKNEFVNLMRRTNDMPIADPAALYEDATARSTISREGWVATGPGGLAEAERIAQPNEVYGTDLRLIFYDDPPIGRYQGRWDRIFSEPRYTDPRANFEYFSTLYAKILANRQPAANADGHASFLADYYRMIAAEKVKADVSLAALSGNRS